MRKPKNPVATPSLKPPSISQTLKHYQRKKIKSINETQPVQPTEETVDRLNIIGKTYPFCVNYKPQINDPL